MTTSVGPTIDLRRHLTDVADRGVAVVPAAVDRPTVSGVDAEVALLPFVAPPSDAHPASDDVELCTLRGPLDRTPALHALRRALVTAVREARNDDGLASWRPDEVFVRRYGRASPGLAAHRDGVRFAWLVATVTIAGSANFLHLDDHHAVVGEWVLGPGDLVLLRGAVPGSRGHVGCPVHAVGGPVGESRCSVAFRHNAMASAARRRPTSPRTAGPGGDGGGGMGGPNGRAGMSP